MAVPRAQRTAQARQTAPSQQPATVRRASPAPHLFTVDEYYKMADAGIFDEDSRVELIDGVIFDMPPIGPGHAGSTGGLGDLLRARLGPTIIVRDQVPLHLGPRSEPEPDLAIVRRREDYYRSAHPTPEDVLLIVEVADSTLSFDRNTKLPLYARAGIQEYWILDLRRGELIVHSEPSNGTYVTVQRLKRGDMVTPVAFPGVSIAVSDLLG